MASGEEAPLRKFFKTGIPPPAKTPEGCVVGPLASERSPEAHHWHHTSKAGPSTFEKAVGTMLGSGCTVIPDVLPLDFVKAVLDKASADYTFLCSELEERRREVVLLHSMGKGEEAHHLVASVERVDFRELVHRDGGRKDQRFQLDRYPYASPSLVYNPIVFPLVRELLGGGDVNLLYMGVMWAFSDGTRAPPPQKWHGDGGHLFDTDHSPPYCINVFYPLVELTDENGPTEFFPGSHRLGEFDKAATSFGLCCRPGSAVLFDYRVKHRGGANRSMERPRPVLYLAYAKTWYVDRGNNRSQKSLVKKAGVSSPPWIGRVLDGSPMPTMKWQDNAASRANKDKEAGGSTSVEQGAETYSGERWVLFEMDIDLGDNISRTIQVFQGDVAVEVASQFCIKHQLDPDQCLGALTETIQQQINSATRSNNDSKRQK